MMHCPLCRHAAHARSSRYLSESTKERYHQCTNINCGHTFVSMESVTRSIMVPGQIQPAIPHPTAGNQVQMSL
ncbi:DNA-binding transcriptional regulator [Acerihabitans sp. TG2]|uniref:DNA-binding transcriptional regulator n=1 Tax=Acerihabitans sp. TG2 TaxID=3096008 RepID=UPI002B237CB7|nr:DNA-binding transcriptional regulator [Acerihabitans sp. TG2]MEA9393285.1 DNA-binding transcriptional regulator [Acerihabitans sp. TG2]